MAVAANPQETFVWGKGGQKKTPEQVQRDREMAQLLIQGGADYSPVDHWLQGAARMVQGGLGGLQAHRANEAETAGMERGKAAFDPILQALTGGGAPTGQASFAGAAPASVPQTADAQAIRQGLISRGLPEHVADGFLMNMQDESGLKPGINEAQPLVPGSRGGYGLYQLTGPRRVAYEQYAQQLGVDPSNVDAQLDFLMSELQGPEAAAAQSILSAPDAGSAAAAIATNFLRPSKQHLDRRVASYTAGGGNLNAQPAQPVQVASLDPSIGMPAQLPEIGPSGGPQLSPAAPAAPAPAQEIAQALMAPPQGGVAPQQANSLLPLLLQASGDPWARKQYGGIIDALMGQQMQQMDPQYQMGLEKSRLELEAMRNPARKRVVVNGRLVYEDTGELVADYSDPKTATVGNTVVDLGTGQPIYEGQPEAPSSVREYDAYAADEVAAGNRPLSRLEYEQALRKSGATNISNVVGGEGDPYQKKFWESMAAADAKSFTDAIQTGDQARRNRINLDRISQLASSTPQGMSAAIINTLGEFGIKTDGLDNVQAMESLISQMVPTQRPPGSGTISDADLRLYKASLPRLINSPGGNQLILETMYAINDHDIAASDIAARVAANELSPAEARKEMRQLPNPFDDWKDKVDASSGGVTEAPNQSQAPTVTTEEQYNALPPGSPYKAPDGSMRIKGNG